jgi:hypothetical protein
MSAKTRLNARRKDDSLQLELEVLRLLKLRLLQQLRVPCGAKAGVDAIVQGRYPNYRCRATAFSSDGETLHLFSFSIFAGWGRSWPGIALCDA